MPDSPTLLGAALLGQYRQQDRRLRPEDRLARYAQTLIQQGTATTPVQSPMEGLARALQGGLGGLTEGYAAKLGEDRDTQTNSKIGRLIAAKDANEAQAIMAESGGDAEMLAPIYGQLLLQKMADERTLTQVKRAADAVGAGSGGAGGGNVPTQQFTVGGGVVPPNVSAAPQLPNVQQAMQFFTQDPELQLQPHQAAALVGRLYGESGVNPGAVNPKDSATGGPSVGISQWNDERLARLRQLAPGADLNQIPLQTQLQFAKSELLGPERASLEALRKAQSVNEAAPAAVGFFRPKDTQGAIAQATTAGNVIYGAPTPEQVAANPGGAAVPPTQIAQGGTAQVAPVAPAPQSPQVGQVPQPQSTYDAGADYEKTAKAAYEQGIRDKNPDAIKFAHDMMLKAHEARIAFQTDLAKKAEERTYKQGETAEERAYKEQEHNRQRDTTTMSREQSDAATFADRMVNSSRLLGQTEQEGQSAKGRLLDTKVFGVGVPGGNYMQSEAYQKFRQAKDDFINAQLRRESGAVISPEEYTAADRQYFPQPGDNPQVVAQKMKNRQIATEGMVRAAGPTYALNPTVNQAPKARVKVSTPEEARKLKSGTQIELPDGTVGVVP